MAAIAAAKELRSRKTDATEMKGKISTGKAVQHLGGYSCEDKLQVWTDGSCLDPRWEAIARAGAGVSFSKDSELNVHFSIKEGQDKRQSEENSRQRASFWPWTCQCGYTRTARGFRLV